MNKKIVLSKVLIHSIFILFSLICVVPIIAIVSISFSGEKDIMLFGYSLLPRNFTWQAYEIIFKNPDTILRGYSISIIVTAVGTAVSLLFSALLAYPISRADFAYKKSITFYVFFTLLFSGGLVPWYVLITRYLNMKDTLLVLIMPYMIVPWNILLLKTYFSKMPFSLIEAAKIDGSGEWGTFFKIVIPLSKPSLATVALFIALSYWNDWWLSLLFIEKSQLFTLQFMLSKIMANIEELNNQMMGVSMNMPTEQLPSESARMAMCILAIGPILFLFPFLQKYFVKGLTVGAIKE